MESYVKVRLDNYNNVCYGGQTLVGKVECMFTSEETIKGTVLVINWYYVSTKHSNALESSSVIY